MSILKFLLLLFIYSLFISHLPKVLNLSSSVKKDPFIFFDDTIQINIYNSTLSLSQRNSYYYWRAIRNLIYYPDNKNLYEKSIPYFTPEKKNYLSELNEFGYPFYIAAALLTISIILYLILRFLFKYCTGPKGEIEDIYDYITYIFLIFGFLSSFILLCIAIHNIGKSK